MYIRNETFSLSYILRLKMRQAVYLKIRRISWMTLFSIMIQHARRLPKYKIFPKELTFAYVTYVSIHIQMGIFFSFATKYLLYVLTYWFIQPDFLKYQDLFYAYHSTGKSFQGTRTVQITLNWIKFVNSIPNRRYSCLNSVLFAKVYYCYATNVFRSLYTIAFIFQKMQV